MTLKNLFDSSILIHFVSNMIAPFAIFYGSLHEYFMIRFNSLRPINIIILENFLKRVSIIRTQFFPL